jgi:hypothetical protein
LSNPPQLLPNFFEAPITFANNSDINNKSDKAAEICANLKAPDIITPNNQ